MLEVRKKTCEAADSRPGDAQSTSLLGMPLRASRSGQRNAQQSWGRSGEVPQAGSVARTQIKGVCAMIFGGPLPFQCPCSFRPFFLPPVGWGASAASSSTAPAILRLRADRTTVRGDIQWPQELADSREHLKWSGQKGCFLWNHCSNKPASHITRYRGEGPIVTLNLGNRKSGKNGDATVRTL